MSDTFGKLIFIAGSVVGGILVYLLLVEFMRIVCMSECEEYLYSVYGAVRFMYVKGVSKFKS